MKRYWLIILIVIVLVIAGYFGWKWYKNSAVSQTVPPGDFNTPEEDISVGPADESSETTRSSAGETVLNINHGNYRGTDFKTYFLTYMGADGKTLNEEINQEGYIRFIMDYPSLVAVGNVISRYQK